MGAGPSVKHRLRRRVIVGASAGAVLLVIGGAAALLLSSHQAPAPLALSSPASGNPQGSLVGTWKVSAGSEVGYRVREKFINQPATTEAVARTTKVTGTLEIVAHGSVLTAIHIHFTADLTALVSQDRYANYQVYQRDFFVRRIYLQTDEFPNAEFTADSLSLPADQTGTIPLVVSGKLSVHGVTKTVTSSLQAQKNGDQVEIAGSINIDMRDFNVAPPDISFTTAEPGVIIEYHLLLVRA